MNQALDRSASMRHSFSNPLLWVPSFVYLSLLATGLYFHGMGLCESAAGTGQLPIFVGALLFLLALEHYEARRAGPHRQLAAALLLVRLAMFAGIAAVDCSHVARALFVLIPFVAYMSLGRHASYMLAAGCLLVFIVQLWVFVPAWYVDRESIADLFMFFIGLVFAISTAGVAYDAAANRARAEQLLADLEMSHQQLKTSTERVVELAAAEERNRLARDIHDSLGHYLSAVSIQLEKAIAFWQHNQREAEQALWDARRAVRQALQDVRQSVSSLRHTEDLFSLSAALAELVRPMSGGRLAVDLHIDGAERGFPKLVLICLFRAAQEGLTNVQRHAQADHVALRVVLGDQEATLLLDDDGQGFDPAIIERLPAHRQEHFGLQGLRERLELVEGTMRISSAPAQGTQVRVTIPKYPRTLARTGALLSEGGL
jgi:signal transduction histidine kinase